MWAWGMLLLDNLPLPSPVGKHNESNSLAILQNSKESVLFLFDEPTTGLHFHDVGKLLQSFRQLIDRGHTIIVIEHNTQLIENVDHVIDLGPKGGHSGGKILASGKPEDIAKNKKSSLYNRLFANSLYQP